MILESKVTGLLVEEALRSRGLLNDSFLKKLLKRARSILSLNKNHFQKIVNPSIIVIFIKLIKLHSQII